VLTLRSGRGVAGGAVLVAVGRRVCSADLGLEAAGAKLGPKGQVLVDERCRTNVSGVWAVGDITGKNWLAHAAAAVGKLAAADALGEKTAPLGPIPAAVFTRPEIGTVGLTEKEARARGPVQVKKIQYRALSRAHTGAARAEELAGLVKLVAEEGSGKLLGAHLIGEAASELLGEATLAVTLGAKLADLAATIHAHPTFAEGFAEAAAT